MAAQITANAQIDVFRAVRPGLLEGDLKRVVDAAFQRAGAGLAFAHIVASGPNALVLHYEGDSGQLADGDALVVDIGATFDEHCSDVSRTYAVSGTFTARQREIIEDTYLVTATGLECLTCACPKQLRDIERGT